MGFRCVCVFLLLFFFCFFWVFFFGFFCFLFFFKCACAVPYFGYRHAVLLSKASSRTLLHVCEQQIISWDGRGKGQNAANTAIRGDMGWTDYFVRQRLECCFLYRKLTNIADNRLIKSIIIWPKSHGKC